MNSHKTYPLVSVVVAIKDEMGYIEKCIEALLHQTYPQEKYEILVYDGMSIDGTKEFLLKISKEHSNIKTFDNPKIIAAAGWNEGFKISQAKYIVIMGGHTQVAPDFIEKNVEILEKENACCAGGKVTAVGEDTKSQAIALAFNHPFGVGDAKYRYSKTRCYVETVNFGMYRKSVIDEVGLIDEKIIRGEDWEYNYRIIKKFGKMIYSPEINSYYYSRTSFLKLWNRQFNAGKYKPEIIRKYPGSMLLRHLIPFIFATCLVFLPIITFFGLNIIYLLTLIILYLITDLLISLWISLKNGLKYLPYLMWAFFIMQFAYGFGFIFGLKYFFKKPRYIFTIISLFFIR